MQWWREDPPRDVLLVVAAGPMVCDRVQDSVNAVLPEFGKVLCVCVSPCSYQVIAADLG